MQSVLGGFLHKKNKNNTSLLLGLFHASVNRISIVLMQITPQNRLHHGIVQVENNNVLFLRRGHPKSRNDGTAERRNGGMTERRKMTPNPKRWNRGTVERRKMTPNVLLETLAIQDTQDRVFLFIRYIPLSRWNSTRNEKKTKKSGLICAKRKSRSRGGFLRSRVRRYYKYLYLFMTCIFFSISSRKARHFHGTAYDTNLG